MRNKKQKLQSNASQALDLQIRRLKARIKDLERLQLTEETGTKKVKQKKSSALLKGDMVRFVRNHHDKGSEKIGIAKLHKVTEKYVFFSTMVTTLEDLN